MAEIIVKYIELFIMLCMAATGVIGALVNAGIVKRREGTKLRKLLDGGLSLAESVKQVAMSQQQVIKNKRFSEATSPKHFKE